MKTPHPDSASPSTPASKKSLNLHAAAAAGTLNEISAPTFSRKTLLATATDPDQPKHFLHVAAESGTLEAVPGVVWVNLHKFQSEKLTEPETALLKDLLELYASLVARYCERLDADPGIYHREIPPDFKSDPTIRALHRKHEVRRLEESPIRFEDLPQRLQQGDDAFHAWSRPWLKLLAAETHPFDKIPEQLRNNAEALEAWMAPWLTWLATKPIESFKIPPELRQNPQAIAARKQHHCNAVCKGDEAALRTVPEELHGEPELLEAMTDGWSAWLDKNGLKGWPNMPDAFRHSDRLQQQAAALWIARIQNEPFDWIEVPRELHHLHSISDAWMASQMLHPQMEPSMAEIAAQPNIARVTLQLWRNSNNWNRQKTGAMLIELRNKPWHLDKLSEAARSHPMILEAAHDGALDFLERDGGYFHVLPKALREEQELLVLAAAAWLDSLKAGHCTWEQIPAEIHAASSLARWKEKEDSKHRKVERELKQVAAEGRLRANPQLRDEELTKKELKSASIRKLRASYWAKKVEQDQMQFLEVPESLLGQAPIQAAMRLHWGPLVRNNPAGFETLPDRVKADEGIQRVYKIATRSADASEQIQD